MNYADIKQYDVANGPGVRISLFVSGCTHHCPNCFNEVAWDFDYGQPFTEETIETLIQYLEPSYIWGLTLLGGEPMEHSNIKGLLPLLRKVKACYPNKTIWCFSGYLFDKDMTGWMMNAWPETKEFLSYIDVMVDGEYVEAQKDLTKRFKGSANQRTIDVPASLREGQVVLMEGYE